MAKQKDVGVEQKDAGSDTSFNIDTVKVRNENLKSDKVLVFDGSIVEFDKDGIAEVKVHYSDYLLSIPGYSEA